MKRVMVLWLLVLLAGASGLQAQDNQGGSSATPVPPEELEKPPQMNLKEPALPPKVQDEQVEPSVTIHKEEDRTVEEYRYNGLIYMVKITPKVGPPYYYIDTDGDGQLELDDRSRALAPVQPVYWKIKEWK